MRVGTWNLNSRRVGRGDRSPLVDLVRDADLDVLLLQETYEPELADFAELFDDAVSAFEVHRTDGLASGKVGCAALARRKVRLQPDSAGLLYELPQPERGLHVQARSGRQPLWLLSWHAPNAAQHSRARKEAAYRAVARAFAARQGSAVAGMDTNMPHDWPDAAAAQTVHAEPDWQFQWDLLGATPTHPLIDVYRDLRDRAGTLRHAPPHGPLAQSTLAGGKPQRFDRIYVTRDLAASHVEHRYQQARAAGSDHALVIADLAWTADEKRRH